MGASCGNSDCGGLGEVCTSSIRRGDQRNGLIFSREPFRCHPSQLCLWNISVCMNWSALHVGLLIQMPFNQLKQECSHSFLLSEAQRRRMKVCVVRTPPPHDLTRSYCICRFCTSIVAQDTSGRLYHGRNLDYPHDILRNLTINVLFLKNGTVCYTWLHSSTFTSAVSLLQGQGVNQPIMPDNLVWALWSKSGVWC